MAKVWSWLAVNLGRHAGLVGAIGLVFTIVLGFGITRLEFATGQDSYLNRDSDVYKDNVAYQERFGGQAMLSLIVMDEGKRVEDLFTPEGIETMSTTVWPFAKDAQDERRTAKVQSLTTLRHPPA